MNLLVFILLLIISEIALRIFYPSLHNYLRTYPDQFQDRAFGRENTIVNWPEKDFDLGWVCKQDSLLKFSNKLYNSEPIIYKINKEGFRNRIDISNKDGLSNKKKIMLLGDSFIMSVYLSEDNSITFNLSNEVNPNYVLYNLGIPGYGIDQSLLAYEKYVKIIAPEIVILFYIDDDIPRVLEAYRKVEGMNKPSFDIANDNLKLRTNSNQGCSEKFFENSYLLNKFYKKYMQYYSIEITKKIFDRLMNQSSLNNHKLYIIRCPVLESFDNFRTNDFYSFKEYFIGKHQTYIELIDSMSNLQHDFIQSLYLEKDGHPSRRGAKYFAKVLSKIIFKD